MRRNVQEKRLMEIRLTNNTYCEMIQSILVRITVQGTKLKYFKVPRIEFLSRIEPPLLSVLKEFFVRQWWVCLFVFSDNKLTV